MFGPPDQALKGPQNDLFGYLGIPRFRQFVGGRCFGGGPNGTHVRILSTFSWPESKTRPNNSQENQTMHSELLD